MAKSVSTDAIEKRLEGGFAQAGVSPYAPVGETSELNTPDLLTEPVEGHPAAMSWKRLLSEHWDVVGIERLTRKKRKNNPIYRLRGPHGETVVAKRSRKERAQVERLIYQEVMPRIPLPGLEFHGLLEEPEGEFCWLFLEEAGGLIYTPLDEAHRALAGRWLGQMHLATLPGEILARLPNRETAYYLQVVRDCRSIFLDHLSRNPTLSNDGAALFNRMVEHLNRLESAWSKLENICEAMPRTLVHGDFSGKNIRVPDGACAGALLVFDWEFAGWGVPATDLAQSVHKVARPDLNVYCSVLKPAYPHLELVQLQGVAACGNAFRMVDEIRWTMMTFPDFGSREYLIKTGLDLPFYEPVLAKALEILQEALA